MQHLWGRFCSSHDFILITLTLKKIIYKMEVILYKLAFINVTKFNVSVLHYLL